MKPEQIKRILISQHRRMKEDRSKKIKPEMNK
jgi:hypothetical protein